ncbi:hypothetical protein T10_10003 [Trichinella papuae]|uniref:Uncharacterized protein n=1 Tax=Trichinella papuae TaxID=268474 RepID=A0A0V1M2S6_9BILA|nr:hypothetical protein T10_9515 [Trichinella papuae]KRZ66139.1 hypothetical protein T10_3084 [Trichinella papuae]KRZ77850.1 hypothetical protein T10_10003 [Trichinella papuae]
MAELLHLAWASRSALISTCSSCNENSMFAFSISISNVWHRHFLQVLKTYFKVFPSFFQSRSETSAPSSSFCKFEKYLKSRRAQKDLNRPILAWKPISTVRLANRTDGSYTSSTPHIMSGPQQQKTPQSSDTNQQVFVSNPLLTTIFLPCEKAVVRNSSVAL